MQVFEHYQCLYNIYILLMYYCTTMYITIYIGDWRVCTVHHTRFGVNE